MEHGVPISGRVETLARTGSELHVLHHGKICGREASVPDPRTWIWARAPRRALAGVFRGGCTNRGDPFPNLQSSLDVFDSRLVLKATRVNPAGCVHSSQDSRAIRTEANVADQIQCLEHPQAKRASAVGSICPPPETPNVRPSLSPLNCHTSILPVAPFPARLKQRGFARR